VRWRERAVELDYRMRRTGPNKRVASEQRVRPTDPNEAGLRMRPDEGESMAFIYDYEAATKLP